MAERQLHFNVNVLGLGSSAVAWRLASDPLGALDLDYYTRVAKIAERGHLDGFFLADSLAPPVPPEAGIWWGLDPVVLLSSLISATEHIGLIGSVTTTFTEPYNLARTFASLDHLSKGRVAWNVVTSYDQAGSRKFGLEALPDREQRYGRAAEFIDVVLALWDSWGPEATVLDLERNVFADSSLIKPVEHTGTYFRVHGALQLPQPPQGHPVLFQAGGSPSGLELAATYVDAVFSAEHTLAGAQRSYETLKSKVVAHGRPASALKIFPGISLVIGATEHEARERARASAELTAEDENVTGFFGRIGVELSTGDLDSPLPEAVRVAYEQGVHNGGFDKATLDLITENPSITPRELVRAGGNVHRTIVGGPEQVADDIEKWFRGGAADGFNLMFDVVEDGLTTFVDHVIPILVKRGLFRSEYTGSTLRHHLGLSPV